MLILMGLNAPRKDVEKVKEKIVSWECTPHEIPGSLKLAIGITGPSSNLTIEEFLGMDSVDEVIRISKPYKLVGREMKPTASAPRVSAANASSIFVIPQILIFTLAPLF